MNISVPSMQELLEAGVHFGHQVRRGHPRMREYIFGAREGVHIINLEHSEKLLQEAADYAYKLGEEGKVILFVGTKKQAQSIIKEAAVEANAPFADVKWSGGFLTNFDEIRRNIKKLTDLAEKQEKGELSHYTKKEQLLISKKIEKFQREWGGIAKMSKLPDALFIVDCVMEKTALAEANRMEIPVIGIADSNCNPGLMAFPIPGNDDATKSIKIITDAVASAYAKGLKAADKAALVKQEKEEAKAREELEKENALIAADVEEAEKAVEQKAVADAKREV